ncbi:hypothetical protein NSA28_04970 [Clostridium perfringens]|uniref:hypothetical protein n=1 Tax=Clostridium perfringens TaxID=1502 RepID=UPI0018D6BEF9|nr:hypothetical protein [Clostridium perfringens]MCR1962970.1 hypothetical protein [Clostridium perfringens]QPR51813.1 hypothetical protein I6G88_02075 [Clostridium perfringens]
MNKSSNNIIPFNNDGLDYEKRVSKKMSVSEISFEDINKRGTGEKFSYNNIKEGLFDMDENKILEKYLDKIDKDRREQEERLSKNIELSEKRVHDERIELERRIIEDSKAREERMEKRFTEVMNSLEKTNTKIDEKIDKMSEKIDNTNKWIVGLCISTIIGIAAIVVTVIVAFLQR